MSPAASPLRTLLGAAGRRSLAVEVGSFTKATATGNQDITITTNGTGFAAGTWAVIFWSVQVGAEASGSWGSNYNQFLGFAANGGGSISEYAAATASQDGQATSNSGRRIAAKAIIYVSNDGSTVLDEASFVAFQSSTTMRINWSTNSGTSGVVMYMVISGLTGAKAVTWDTGSAGGNVSVTGVGFTPDLVIHALTEQTSLGTAADAQFGWGCMNAAGEQWANGFAATDNLPDSDTGRYQRTNSCLLTVKGDGTTTNTRATFVSMDADGFTVNFPGGGLGTNNQDVISLCLDGVQSKIGAFNKSTTAAPVGQEVASNHGWTPRGLLLSTIGQAASASPVAGAVWATGATDGTNERCVGLVDADGQATTATDSIWRNDKVMTSPNGGPTEDAVADWTAWDVDSFTVTWTTNDATAREMLYLLVG